MNPFIYDIFSADDVITFIFDIGCGSYYIILVSTILEGITLSQKTAAYFPYLCRSIILRCHYFIVWCSLWHISSCYKFNDNIRSNALTNNNTMAHEFHVLGEYFYLLKSHMRIDGSYYFFLFELSFKNLVEHI